LGLVEGFSNSDPQNGHFIKRHNGVILGQIFGPSEQWNLVDGCETWSVTLREYGPSFYQNRVLRKVLGPEREVVNENRRNFLTKI